MQYHRREGGREREGGRAIMQYHGREREREGHHAVP